MKTVTVKKTELLKTLKKNKKSHKEDYDLSWKEFKKRATENFEARLKQVKNLRKGQHIELWVNLELPEDHTSDYDRAIEMLEWEVGDEVTLQEHEFAQFVQDQWGWSGKFAATNQMYTGSVSPSKSLLAGGSKKR